MKKATRVILIIAAILWVSILLVKNAGNNVEGPSSVRVLNSDNVNTRTGPGTEYEKAKKFAQYGDKLHILKDTAGWIKYTLDESSDWSGWVKKEFTVPLDEWDGKQRIARQRPSYEVKGEVALKTIKIENIWNENDRVRQAYSEFVKLGKKAFSQEEEVKAIYLGVLGEVVDQYGNLDTIRVIELKMTKSNFKKFTWNNLEGVPIYRRLERHSEIHKIHPVISKDVNINELYLILD